MFDGFLNEANQKFCLFPKLWGREKIPIGTWPAWIHFMQSLWSPRPVAHHRWHQENRTISSLPLERPFHGLMATITDDLFFDCEPGFFPLQALRAISGDLQGIFHDACGVHVVLSCEHAAIDAHLAHDVLDMFLDRACADK